MIIAIIIGRYCLSMQAQCSYYSTCASQSLRYIPVLRYIQGFDESGADNPMNEYQNKPQEICYFVLYRTNEISTRIDRTDQELPIQNRI